MEIQAPTMTEHSHSLSLAASPQVVIASHPWQGSAGAIHNLDPRFTIFDREMARMAHGGLIPARHMSASNLYTVQQICLFILSIGICPHAQVTGHIT